MPFQIVQPAFAWALLGLAIPIIIHLMFRRRSRKVNLGTLRFLRIVLEENARRRKLKRWLLLALRMACLALLVGLFARPFLLARDSAGKDRLLVVLIDRSASMQLKEKGKRLIDLAVERARDVINNSGEKTQVELAFFDQTARPLGGAGPAGNVPGSKSTEIRGSTPPARQAERQDSGPSTQEILEALAAPESLFSATNYGTALAWARDLSLTSPHGRKELFIYTDMQRSGLDWTAVEAMPAEVQTHVVDLGRSAVNNVALTTVQAPRHIVRPGDAVSLSAGVFNAGPFPLEKLPVVLTLESGTRKHVLRERLTLEPQATGSVAFEVPALNDGFWQGSVRIETEDDLAFDNQRFVGILCAPPVNVLLADGDPRDTRQLSETYFLEAALRLAATGETYAESPFRATVAPLAPGDRLPDLAPYRIVVLANVSELSRGDASSLARFVQSGGSLMVFTGDRVAAEGYQAATAAGLTVGEIGPVVRAHDLPHRIDHWDEGHPLFEPFNDPQHGDLRRFAFEACTRLTPADDAHVIGTFRSGAPALVEKRLEKGRILWFTAGCGREWSDWTRSRLYLPFVHQMLGYLAGLTGGGPVRDVLIDSTTPLAADVAPGFIERDGYIDVVNTGPRESETDRCTVDEFATRFQLTLYNEAESQPAAAARAAAFSGDLRDDEIWQWVLFGLVGVLLVEGFVANRTAA